MRNLKAGLWIDIQYFFHEVFSIGGDKFGDVELPSQNFFVESVCILVFEGQIAAEQSIHDDSARPDINVETVVVLASDHLRCGITW